MNQPSMPYRAVLWAYNTFDDWTLGIATAVALTAVVTYMLWRCVQAFTRPSGHA